KSGFFLIDRRAILDSMVWRHPSAAIDDPRPAAGSFSVVDVHRLSAHVIKLRDIPEGVLVLFGLSRVWKSRVFDSVFQGADTNVMGIYYFLYLLKWTGAEVQEEPHLDVRPALNRLLFYCIPSAAADVVILNPTLVDLTVGTLSYKIFVKAEAFQSERPLLLVPLRAMLLSAIGNQGGSSTTPAAKGLGTRGFSKCYENRKSGFFLIDRRAILDSMVWRHPSAAIDDPRPAAGSFSVVDVHRLSAHVIKLRDIPEGILDWEDMMRYSLPWNFRKRNVAWILLPNWHGLKLNKYSREADLSKDMSGPESPPELQRSWCVKGHIRFGVISSIRM
nr:hypothetical protein [Tanacetum cinerariifolium]